MNFSKEYINECDCPEIQGLKNGKIDKGDWWVEEGGMPDTARNECFLRSGILWLPTGDQLDEEIVKICEDSNGSYDTYYKNKSLIVFYNDEGKSITQDNPDPLIAKIKLLKELLNE